MVPDIPGAGPGARPLAKSEESVQSDESALPESIVPESSKTPFYPALDGLRTLAVALVLLTHYASAYVPWGWLGVQIFFVLSGFLITGILFDTARDPHRLRNFYVRRCLRIFPLYYAFLAVSALVAWLTHGSHSAYYLLWPFYLQNFFWLFTHGQVSDVLVTGAARTFSVIGHLWSLAVEEQFYLLWPPVVFWIKDRRRLMQLCAVLILLRLALAAYWQTHLPFNILQPGLIYRMLPTQCDGFLLGGLVALWLRGRRSPRVLAASGWLALLSVSAYATLLALLEAHPAWIAEPITPYSAFQSVAGMPLGNLAFAVLVLAATQPGTWIQRLGNLPPMRSLGRVSYGLYVFHLPLYAITGGPLRRALDEAGIHTHHDLIHGLIATALTIALAYASFHWFEKPFLLLKNRFTSISSRKERLAAAHPL